MDFAAELAAFDLPPELTGRLRQWAEHTREQATSAQPQAGEVARLEAELKASRLKIDALIHEIAMLKRLRFGARSEALAAHMKDLFDETLAADLGACEARLEALRQQSPGAETPAPGAAAKRRRAGGGGGDRRGIGRAGLAGVGGGQQVRRSFALVPA